MKQFFIAFVAVAIFSVGGLLFLFRNPHVNPRPSPDLPVSPEIVNAVTLDAEVRIGAGRTVDNLTVFPVLADEQPDLGPFTSLDIALGEGKAEVRERSAGGSVGELVIENKGDIPIFVLAGTVVKGGKQDRQIAQDFAVGPKQTVPVSAFCVEQGRWSPEREGARTEGKFATSKMLAPASVRAAGQYKKNQGEVWEEVGNANRKNGKVTPTGTLVASIDDEEIGKERTRVRAKVDAFLGGLVPEGKVVGLAYAVDGKVRGVRWFANHALYRLFRDSLLETASLEAITAQRAAARGEGQPPAPVPAPEAVKAFVIEIDKAAPNEERAAGQSVNSYHGSGQGWGAKASMPAPSPTAPGKKVRISSDFVAK